MTDDPSNELTEEQLHEAWRGGSRADGAKLYGRYCFRLIEYGRELGLADADAQDLSHETLLEAAGLRYRRRTDESYWGWLTRLARQRFESRPLDEDDVGIPPRRLTTPRGALDRQRLLDSIARMPASQRVVFERILFGDSPREVAASLNVERSAIYMRMHRGRRWLSTGDR